MKMEKRKETRLTIVDENGRVYERWNIIIEEDVQDEGRTLKLFVTERGKKKR